MGNAAALWVGGRLGEGPGSSPFAPSPTAAHRWCKSAGVRVSQEHFPEASRPARGTPGQVFSTRAEHLGVGKLPGRPAVCHPKAHQAPGGLGARRGPMLKLIDGAGPSFSPVPGQQTPSCPGTPRIRSWGAVGSQLQRMVRRPQASRSPVRVLSCSPGPRFLLLGPAGLLVCLGR